MNKEPEYFQYKNKNVYDLDSLVQYDQAYFYGCLKHKRDAVIKKQIPEEHYFYAKMARFACPAPSALTKNGWSESNSNYSRAKILVTEDWAKANVNKLVEKYTACKLSSPISLPGPRPSTSRIVKVVKKYREAPDLLKLEEREKFRDNEDNIFEVEVRGVRDEDKIFFKGKDIERVFEMDNLVDNISYSYTKNEDFEIFLLAQDHIVSVNKNSQIALIGYFASLPQKILRMPVMSRKHLTISRIGCIMHKKEIKNASKSKTYFSRFIEYSSNLERENQDLISK
jgi:hypothetical protein